MANGQPGSLLRYLRTLFVEGPVTGLTDGQLLERFTAKRAESSESAHAAETAFATLVDRHGAMVWGVCRRILRDTHEAEDAFQATFLLLVRKAGSVQVDGSLGRWLYGVAHRVAHRARSEAGRRESYPRRVPQKSSEDPSVEVELEDLGDVLNEEVDRLPVKYRCPIELCYFQGMTYDQAAQQLDWPVATVKSRLTKGRHQLRARLSRRGFAKVEAIMAGPVFVESRSAIPRAVVYSTIRAVSSGKAAAFSSAVTELTEEVLKMVLVEKLRLFAVGLLIVVGLGVGAVAQQSSKERERIAEPVSLRTEARSSDEASGKGSVDPRWVKSLPNGATIEIVGISPHPSGPNTWWGPDGKPLAQPPCERSPSTHSSDEDAVQRAVTVRITHLPPGADYDCWVDESRGGSNELAKLNGNPVPNLQEMITVLDRRQETLAVRFRVAAGAWKTVQSWGTSSGARGNRTGASYIFSLPIETKKGTALSVSHNIKDDSVRLVAIDRNGKEHPADLRSGGGVGEFRQLLGEFDLPLEQIQEFRVQTRPYQEIEVPDVPLNPAKPA